MRRFFLSVFYFINLFSTLLIKGENFHVRINQLTTAQPIITKNLVMEKKSFPKEQISNFTLKTKSKIKIPVTLYDRGSDVLLVAAPALPAPKESMKPFAKMFSSYDVITFDYRWNGQYEKDLAKSILTGKPVQRVLFDPIEELQTVVNYATKQKVYNKVIGLGECYSCFHFAKVQSDAIKKYGSGPFTHLILDSCWHSLRNFAERICYDPLLPVSPQDGGAPRAIKWITDSRLFKGLVLGTVFALMNDISIERYIADVGIPVLFVHGQNDLFVPPKHFEKIWNATNKENRAAFLTPYRHSDNLGNKKLYRYIAEQFVASQSMQDFEEKILK